MDGAPGGAPGATFTGRRWAQLAGDGVLFTARYSHPALSPDGTLLAWISDRDGRPRAWVAPLPDGEQPVTEPARPLSADEDVQALAWSPDDSWLACQFAPGGGECTRVRLVSPDGSEHRDLAPDAAAATLGAWSPSGRQLGLTLFARGDRSGDGLACLVDVRDGTSTVLATGVAPRVCAISGDGLRAVVRLGRRGARGLQLIDLRTAQRTELLPGTDATVADARFGATGQLLLHTDAGRERAALLAVGQPGATDPSVASVVAQREDADLDLVALDPSGARAVLAWNVDGRSQLDLVDLRSGIAEPLHGVAGDVVTSAGFARGTSTVVVASEGPTVPPAFARIELDPARPATPLLPAHALPTGSLVEPALHVFEGEDGLALTGWLFRPPGALGAVPTLLWLHGGPEAQERPVFQPLFQALLAEGISVFAPNVRGSGGYGQSFSRADDRERRFVAITDVRAATEYLVRAGLADSSRIGMSGRSYGGYLTLAALARFPELFRVGVDVCGIADFATFYERTEPWIARAATTKYGDPHADADLLRALSPIHLIDRVRAPLLVVHGANDTNVPLADAVQVVGALRARGASPEFLVFDDEGHEVHGRANQAVFVREVVQWVTAHLQGLEEQTA